MDEKEYNEILSKEIPFVQDLVQRFSDLAPIMQDHVAENNEILPHVFMGDVKQYAVTDGSQRQELVRHLNDALVNEGEDVQNLIAVSFVEYLDEEELERVLQGVQAEALRAEWHILNP